MMNRNSLENENRHHPICVSLPSVGKRALVSPATSITLTEDVDAFFHSQTLGEFARMILRPVTLCVRRMRGPYCKIKSGHKTCFGSEKRKAIKLPHTRFGAALNTSLKTIDLFIVLVSFVGTLDELQNKVFDAVNTALADTLRHSPAAEFYFQSNSNSDAIDKTIEVNDLVPFLDRLEVLLQSHEPYIYIETHGTKIGTVATVSAGFAMLDRIAQTFRIEMCPEALVDVCVSSLAGPGLVTFARLSLLEAFLLAPNFHPFASSAVNNCNMNLDTSRCKFKAARELLTAVKVNFYSSLSRTVLANDTKKYECPLIVTAASHFLLGNWVAGKKTHCVASFEEFGAVRDRHAARGASGYSQRSEVTTTLSRLTLVRDILAQKAKLPEHFVCCDSEKAVAVLEVNIRAFLVEIFNVGEDDYIDMEKMARGVVAELIMRCFYLRGARKCALSKQVCEFVLARLPDTVYGLGTINNIRGLVDGALYLTTARERYDLIQKAIHFDPNLSAINKRIMKSAFEILSKSASDPLAIILDGYAVYMLRDKEATYLAMTTGPTCDNKLLCAKKAFTTAFYEKKKNGGSLPGRLLLTAYAVAANITLEVALQQLLEYAEEKNIYAWFDKRAKAKPYTLPPSYPLTYNMPDRRRTVHRIEDPWKLEALALTSLVIPGKPRIKGCLEETIRFMHAMCRHGPAPTRHLDMYLDFIYGWWPVRSRAWLRAKAQHLGSITANMTTFIQVINKVRKWTPALFDYEERKKYIADAGKTLTNEQLVRYENLLSHARDVYYDDFDEHQLMHAAPADIVRAVFGDTEVCTSLISRMSSAMNDRILSCSNNVAYGFNETLEQQWMESKRRVQEREREMAREREAVNEFNCSIQACNAAQITTEPVPEDHQPPSDSMQDPPTAVGMDNNSAHDYTGLSSCWDKFDNDFSVGYEDNDADTNAYTTGVESFEEPTSRVISNVSQHSGSDDCLNNDDTEQLFSMATDLTVYPTPFSEPDISMSQADDYVFKPLLLLPAAPKKQRTSNQILRGEVVHQAISEPDACANQVDNLVSPRPMILLPAAPRKQPSNSPKRNEPVLHRVARPTVEFDPACVQSSLLYRYGFRVFSLEDCKKISEFSFSDEEWCEVLDCMTRSQMIRRSDTDGVCGYQLALMCKNGLFINESNLRCRIVSNMRSRDKIWYTVAELRRMMNAKSRPVLNEWNVWLTFSVSSGVLKVSAGSIKTMKLYAVND